MTWRWSPLGSYVRNRMWRSFTIEEWWKRPQKKASMKEVHKESSSRPMSRKLPPRPFEAAVKFWRWRFQSLWHPFERTLLMAACLWHVSFSLNHWQSLNHAPSQIVCLSVIIPDSVIVVGAAAFVGCQALKHIRLPRSLTSISKNTFETCNSLTSIAIPDSVRVIEKLFFFPLQITGKSCHILGRRTNWWVRISFLRCLGEHPHTRVCDNHWKTCLCRV